MINSGEWNQEIQYFTCCLAMHNEQTYGFDENKSFRVVVEYASKDPTAYWEVFVEIY